MAQLRSIGRHSYIGGGESITTPTTIGNFTSIAPRVRIQQRDNHACVANPTLVSCSTHRHIPGYPIVDSLHGVVIGNDVWIGEEVIILAPVKIGDGARIGAFTVVAKSIPPYAKVVGNPGRVYGYRFDEDTINALLDMQWWDWSDEVIAARQAAMQDAAVLVEQYYEESFRTNYG